MADLESDNQIKKILINWVVYVFE